MPSVDDLVYDMYGAPLRSGSTTLGAHEGPIDGIIPTTYDYYKGARRGVIGPYPTNGYDSPNHDVNEFWTSHNAWGVALVMSGTHTVRNVRLHVDQLEIYHLVDGAWVAKKQGEDTFAKTGLNDMDGGYYQSQPFGKTRDFTDDPSYLRKESSGWSISLAPTINNSGQPVPSLGVVHFFWAEMFPRIYFETSGVQVAITAKARLISDDPAVNVDDARFLLHISGDLFKEGTHSHTGSTAIHSNQSHHPSNVNPPFAIPRWRKLTSEWQSFSHVTGTETQIRGYPTIPFLDGGTSNPPGGGGGGGGGDGTPTTTEVDLSACPIFYNSGTYQPGVGIVQDPTNSLELGIAGLTLDPTATYTLEVDLADVNSYFDDFFNQYLALNLKVYSRLPSNPTADPDTSYWYFLAWDPDNTTKPTAGATTWGPGTVTLTTMGPGVEEWDNAVTAGETLVTFEIGQGSATVTGLRYTKTGGNGGTAGDDEGYVDDPDDGTNDVYELVVQIHSPAVDTAPSSITVSVSDLPTTDDVLFYIDGHKSYTHSVVDDGDIDLVSIPVRNWKDGNGDPVMTIGEHILHVVQGSADGSATFLILNNPSPVKELIQPDAAPVFVPDSVLTTRVRRWVFQDLKPGGLGSWVLPMNPQEMNTPAFSRQLSFHPTTLNKRLGGRFHVYEDAFTPVEWTFKGYSPTAEMRAMLEAFADLNRRWYLHDHRGRAWKVTFTDLQLTPRLTQIWNGEYTDEGHDYEATVLVLEREWVQL